MDSWRFSIDLVCYSGIRQSNILGMASFKAGLGVKGLIKHARFLRYSWQMEVNI